MRLLALLLLIPCIATAAPQLRSQAELVAGGKLKIRVLSGAKGIPPPTPQAQTFIRTTTSPTGGVKQEEIKKYDETELAYVNELLGLWRDKKGNEMRLAKPESYPWEDGIQYFTTKQIGETTYHIDFKFAEKVTDKVAQKLLKEAAASLSDKVGTLTENGSSMKWWEPDPNNKDYRFLTNLPKSQGKKFVGDAMRMMGALRKSFEFYVPAQKAVGKCAVRIFRTLAEYREYRASTGDNDQMSCGLWDPSREELLIAAENREQAEGTMRHESFHQYLHYATGNGQHATWFNEGHATFFEDVKFNAAKQTIKVEENENRASWVNSDPEKYAAVMKSVIQMPHAQFYSGDANLHYCTAWAIVYFLQRGAYTKEEWAPYRKVIPKYLALTAAGTDAATATTQAWAEIGTRDLAQDFLEFWHANRGKAKKLQRKEPTK